MSAEDGNWLYVEGEVLTSIDAAFVQHEGECRTPPYLLLLNPGNYELLGWDEVYGLPVLPDRRVPPLHCRLVCGSRGWAGSYHGRRVLWVDGQPFVEDPNEQQAA